MTCCSATGGIVVSRGGAAGGSILAGGIVLSTREVAPGWAGTEELEMERGIRAVSTLTVRDMSVEG